MSSQVSEIDDLRYLLTAHRCSDGRRLFETITAVSNDIAINRRSSYYNKLDAANNFLVQVCLGRRPPSDALHADTVAAVSRRAKSLPEREELIVRLTELLDKLREAKHQERPYSKLLQMANSATDMWWFLSDLPDGNFAKFDPVCGKILELVGLSTSFGLASSEQSRSPSVTIGVPNQETAEMMWHALLYIDATPNKAVAIATPDTLIALQKRVQSIVAKARLRIVVVESGAAPSNVLLLDPFMPESIRAYNYYMRERIEAPEPKLLVIPRYVLKTWVKFCRQFVKTPHGEFDLEESTKNFVEHIARTNRLRV